LDQFLSFPYVLGGAALIESPADIQRAVEQQGWLVI
jgi:hypothetical protein